MRLSRVIVFLKKLIRRFYRYIYYYYKDNIN